MDKEIGMPNTMDYTPPVRDFSKLPSSTQEYRSDQPAAHFCSIFNPSDRTLDRHHLISLSSPPPQQSCPNQQPHRARRRPDPITSPLASTSIGATPVLNSRALPSSPQPPAAGTTSSTIDTTSSKPSVRYRECLKNHAASGGGHVVDGCGEFMPNGEGTPEAFKCAACECHRNFHRKEVEGELRHVFYCFHGYNPNISDDLKDGFPSPHLSHHLHAHFPPSSFPQHHKFYHGPPTPSASLVPPMMMTFGEGGSAQVESSSEDLNIFQCNGGGHMPVQQSSSKKRFRTKFTQEQKEKMMEFAETLGWRIQKHDEQEVQQFCSRVGVKRHVLKVWMHNNKQAMKK